MLRGPSDKVSKLTVVMALVFLASRANADAKGKPGAQILIRNPGEPGSKPFPGFIPVKKEPDLNVFQTSAAEHRFADRNALPVNSEEIHLEPVERKTVQPTSRLRSQTVTVPEPSDKKIEPVKRTRFRAKTNARAKANARKIVLKRRKVKKFRSRTKPKPKTNSPDNANDSDLIDNQILDDGVALAPEAQRGGSLAELAFATLTDEEQRSESREARPFPRNRDIQIMKSPSRKTAASSIEKVTAVSNSRLRTKPQATSRLRNNVQESRGNNAVLRNTLFGPRKRFKGIIRKGKSKSENIIGPQNIPSAHPTRQSLVIHPPDSPFPNFPAKLGEESPDENQKIQEQRDGRTEEDDNIPNIGFEELTLNPRQNTDSDFVVETFMPILRPDTKERQSFPAVSAVPDISTQPEIEIGTQEPLPVFPSLPPIIPINNGPFPVNPFLNPSPVRGEPLPITQFLPFDTQPIEPPREPPQMTRPVPINQAPVFPNIFNNPNPKARQRRPQLQPAVVPTTQPVNTPFIPQITPITELNTQRLPTPQPIFRNPSIPSQTFFDQPKSSTFPSFPAGSLLPAIVPVRSNPELVPENAIRVKQPKLLSPQFPPILQDVPEAPAAAPLLPVRGLVEPLNQEILSLGAGGMQSHTSTRIGNTVQGQYSYVDVDGSVKVVAYKTDGPNSRPQITHTTEAPQSIHHQTSPHSIHNSASHVILHPSPRPFAHLPHSPVPVHQPTFLPEPQHQIATLLPVPVHPKDPPFLVRHHGSTVVPRNKVTAAPVLIHPSSPPQHSAPVINHPPQVQLHPIQNTIHHSERVPTPVHIFTSPAPHHSSFPINHGPTQSNFPFQPAPHHSPIAQRGPPQNPQHRPAPAPHNLPNLGPNHSLPHHGPTIAPHNLPTLSPIHSPPHHGPTLAPHHGPTLAPHYGPTLAPHHRPTLAPHHRPTAPHHRPTLAPHHRPTAPHHPRTQAPHHSPTPIPQHYPTTSPHHSPSPAPYHHRLTPFVHHGSHFANQGPARIPHIASSPTPGHTLLPSFTPGSVHHPNPFIHHASKRPRFIPHPPLIQLPSPTPYTLHPSPYPPHHYHHGQVPSFHSNPGPPTNFAPHSLVHKVPSLTFFPTASPTPLYHSKIKQVGHSPTPSPIVTTHPVTNKPTVHHLKPTSSPFPSPTPTHGARVEHYPSPSPVPLLYQPNRIIFTPKPFVHTSVRPVFRHSTPVPIHGASRAPFFHSSPAPIYHRPPTPIYQPTTPIPLHLRTPMPYHASPGESHHPHTTPVPFFTSGPSATPTPAHFFFSTPYPITPYPPLKYSPTPTPTPFILPANFPYNGHALPAHVPFVTARSHEVPEIAQESVDTLSVVKAPPKKAEEHETNEISRSDDEIIEVKENEDRLKLSSISHRRNPKKYRTSRNYRHFYEKT